MIISSLTLLIIFSFLYILGLCYLYFSKVRINNTENKIYKCMLISNVFGLILQFLCDLISWKYTSLPPLLSDIMFRLYLLYFFVWLACMIIYLIEITSKNKKKMIKAVIIYYIISMLISLFLPYSLYRDVSNKIYYTQGPAINYVYIMSSLGCLFIGIVLFMKRKSISKKKSIPILLFMLFGIISAVIQMFKPEIVIITIMESFICFLMYFTIENPDTKVLEELHKAKVISDNANEEKTLFLYNMTNEIRSITKEIDHSAEEILDEADNEKANIENIKSDARDIKGSTARFTSMTNEVLDISSIDAANTKIYNEKYNIKLLLKELVKINKQEATSKGLDFRVNIASDIPEYLYGDGINLKKVLNILLNNSIEYTNKGYIEFSVNSIIKNNIVRLIITIEDSGIGMKADEIKKVFTKKDERKEDNDLGNNLYNAKKLITLMNGTLIPNSIYGRGTVIKVILDQVYEKDITNLDKYSNFYDKKKILLIDDSKSSQKILDKILGETNIIIDYAQSGKEGLDKVRSHEKYDLILLDEEMEPLNGHIVMKKLQMIRNFNTKVIILTKDNKYEFDDEYLKEGFIDYIIKSSDKKEMQNKISKYLK